MPNKISMWNDLKEAGHVRADALRGSANQAACIARDAVAIRPSKQIVGILRTRPDEERYDLLTEV